MARIVTLILCVAAALAVSSASAGAPDGSISGTVYHDLDRDGVRDASEPGLQRSVSLAISGTQVAAALSDPDGSYQFLGLKDGEYTLDVDADQLVGECNDYDFSFNPYANQSYCLEWEEPWNVVPEGAVEVTVADVPAMVRDFAVYEADVMVLAGIAMLEDGWAPPGTLIEAVFNGIECGSTQAMGPTVSGLTYVLQFLGGEERKGCPSPGDSLRFRIDGLDAPEVRFYEPIGDNEERLQLQPLTAIRDHAWLWAERRTDAPPAGTTVQALIDGTVCGSVDVDYISGYSGFSRLLVASDALIEGCGTPGAPISFRTQALDGAVTLPWSAHLREMSPRFYGDVNCNYGASAVDALLVLQVVSGMRTGFPCPEGADVNGNDSVDAIDAALVLQLSAGIIQRLPVGA